MPSRRREEKKAARRAAAADIGALRLKRAFHRGETVNFFPRREDFDKENFLDDYLLKGWVPPKPVLTRGMKITAFGSCFAGNITHHLSAIGFDLSRDRAPDIYISRMSDGMVNTAAILGQFQWALENKKQPEGLWHGHQAEGYGYYEGVRQRTRDVFLGTDFFIITLGLSEVWYDAQTGGTFWRAVPEESFDPKRHKFRVMSFAETKHDIAQMHRLIRTHVPNAKLLFTISPIPLAATFRPVGCITANSASKAIIRAALDEFLREHESEINETLFYFPSMELVTQCFLDPWHLDARHPESYVIETIMKLFEATYCEGVTTREEAIRFFRMFRLRNLRTVSSRRIDDEAERELIKEARLADREGRRARRGARGRHASLMGKEPRTAEDDAPAE